jgi:hypothetical protein
MSRRHWASFVLVLVFEVWLYTKYAALGAEFHFWLHTLFGAALGLVALTLLRLARRRRAGSVASWEAGWLGQLYSVFPDILFLAFGVLHMLWMDWFAFHISLHFVPRPLLTMWLLFTLALAAYGLASVGRRMLSASVLLSCVGIAALALALAPDVPVTLGEIRDHDGLALICPGVGHVEHRRTLPLLQPRPGAASLLSPVDALPTGRRWRHTRLRG